MMPLERARKMSPFKGQPFLILFCAENIRAFNAFVLEVLTKHSKISVSFNT